MPDIRPTPEPTREYGFLSLMVDTADFDGLRAFRATWLNLVVVWALGLVASGTVAVAMALRSTY